MGTVKCPVKDRKDPWVPGLFTVTGLFSNPIGELIIKPFAYPVVQYLVKAKKGSYKLSAF
jgi:hypothetical protein